MTLLCVVDLKNLLPPSSGKKNTVKMQVADSSEILVPVYQAKWRHIPENTNPDSRHREYLIPHKTSF
jgi:hypothetical protein